MKVLAILFLLLFLGAGCTNTDSGSSVATTPNEELENAIPMNEETKDMFDEMREEFEKTGEIPDYLESVTVEENPEITSVPKAETIEPPIEYEFTLFETHDKGETIVANALVSKDTTESQVKELLEYLRDVGYKGYTSITITAYTDATSAQTPSADLNQDDSNLAGQLKEGKIILY